MVVSYSRAVLIIGTMMLTGCGETITHKQTYSLPQGKFQLVVSSIGGALGEERYELKNLSSSQSQTFFSGANFSEFAVGFKGDKLRIQMCKGFIDHAEPLSFASNGNIQLIRLDLDWNCKDKRQEA